MVCSLCSIYFDSFQLGIDQMYKTLDYWSRDMLNTDLIEKDLEIMFPPLFCVIFQEKCFTCYILLTDQIS